MTDSFFLNQKIINNTEKSNFSEAGKFVQSLLSQGSLTISAAGMEAVSVSLLRYD